MSRTSLTQGDRRIGSWPMRGYHPWSITLFKTFHQLVHFTPLGTQKMTVSLNSSSIFFMSSEEMKGDLLRPSVLTLYEMRIFMSRTHSTESTSLKISIETPLETLPQVLYPNTRTNVGLWCLSWVFHWLDTGRPPFLSCSMSELNLTWNFVPKTILHCFTSHLYYHACWGTGKFFNCPKCKEVILD